MKKAVSTIERGRLIENPDKNPGIIAQDNQSI